ncbi:MAG: hypothetical protein M5U34_34360 [Chloroflexi bacterium]|nr:hypothetical protein [Chloroflexota bacterium]
MNESIFGLFFTDERRARYIKELRSGVKHLNQLQPYAPGPEDAPRLTVTVESEKRIERVECVLSEPATAVFPLSPYHIDWDHSTGLTARRGSVPCRLSQQGRWCVTRFGPTRRMALNRCPLLTAPRFPIWSMPHHCRVGPERRVFTRFFLIDFHRETAVPGTKSPD